ncbi:NAD(P)/FAD-dependent oxidoreductase [Chloroflexota bacterium]
MDTAYDVIIIGGGPAGLTAGIYTCRANLHTLLIEKGGFGGEIANAELVENYPGFSDGISGAELGAIMATQAMNYGIAIRLAEVHGIKIKGEQKIVATSDGDFSAKSLIIAGGAEPLKLDVPGEDRFAGSDVSYCAMCDAPRFKDRLVAVAGGGDAGITDALHLAKFASKVTVIEIIPRLTATKVLQDKATAEPKIDFLCGTKIEAIEGEERLSAIKIKNVNSNQTSVLEISGILIRIGVRPNTEYLKGIVPLDELGQVIVNDLMETKVPSIFAAGDIRRNSARQVITAAGDGAMAAISAEKFFRGQE